MEYTKGEWNKIAPDEDGRYHIINGFTEIALVYDGANAHLISAAPDMYEALKAFESYFVSDYPVNKLLELRRFAIQLMNRALAKAEGK